MASAKRRRGDFHHTVRVYNEHGREHTLAISWATSGLPKNRAYGGVAGHVFEKPGRFLVTLTVTDRNGARSSAQQTLTVDDADVAWPADKTACISSTGNFALCPAPAGSGRITSTAFGSALTDALNAGYRRILYRRGDQFSGGAYSAPSGIPTVLIGAYGESSAARPLITMSGAANAPSALGVRSNDWRITDLEFLDQGTTLRGIATDARIENLLVTHVRVQTRTDTANIFFPTNGPPEVSSYIAIVDNDLRGNANPVTLSTSSGTCLYGGAYNNFVAGNRCGQASSWQIRIIHNDRSAFQQNLIEQNGGAYECIKYHCAGGVDVKCRFNVVSPTSLSPPARTWSTRERPVRDRASTCWADRRRAAPRPTSAQ
jgi:hypothetical protein